MGRWLNALIINSKYDSQQKKKKEALFLFVKLTSVPTLYSKGAHVALKIIKNIDRYREAALSEVQVLEQLKALDPDKRW